MLDCCGNGIDPLPFVELPSSRRASRSRPVQIHYRGAGSGPPLIFLHGGWGYGAYPINRQITALRDRVRFVIPDRSGYGRSERLPGPTPTDFHQRAAEETLLLMDALSIKRASFWGHSDGSVIAVKIGLLAPERCERLILEAFHLRRSKINSQDFFKQFARSPGEVKEKMQKRLAADHGEEHWKKVVQRNCQVWLKLAAELEELGDDLYGGLLSKIKVPLTFMHGRCDPRTAPGEIEQAQKMVPHAKMRFVEEGRHSPHSERNSWRECNEILEETLRGE